MITSYNYGGGGTSATGTVALRAADKHAEPPATPLPRPAACLLRRRLWLQGRAGRCSMGVSGTMTGPRAACGPMSRPQQAAPPPPFIELVYHTSGVLPHEQAATSGAGGRVMIPVAASWRPCANMPIMCTNI